MERLILVIAKVTDDILMKGHPEEMERFSEMIQKKLEVSEIIIDEAVHFNGCR